jgi:peptide chain release factor 1
MIERGRMITAEHEKLKEQLANSYDGKTAKKLGELSRTANTFRRWREADQVSIMVWK